MTKRERERLAKRIARVRGFASAMRLRQAIWQRSGRWDWACREDLRARLASVPTDVLAAAGAS